MRRAAVMRMHGRAVARTVCCAIALLVPGWAAAQGPQVDFSQMSGIPRPVNDLPAGSVSVRVVRGGPTNDVAGQAVEFTVNGERSTVITDAQGRAELTGLSPGARVQAVAVVEGERLESQEMVVGANGIRVLLVATDPAAAARAEADRRLAESPAAQGSVVMGPETRIVAQLADDRLTLFYVLQIVNSARVPVDIGGPLIFELPREARQTTILEGSSTQATANGPRIIVTGPFAPGFTNVDAAFEMPVWSDTVRVTQRWPANLQEVTVLATQSGNLSLASDQFAETREFTDQGRRVLLGTGPAIPAGQTLTFEISGLPFHPRWPRYLALSLAAIIVGLGFWAAATARPRKAVA